MVEKKYINFIEKLTKMTKDNLIKWEYLDSSTHLCQNMNWMEGDSGLLAITGAISGKLERTYEFDRERSFYCKSNENYIVLYVTTGNPAIMFVIPPTFKKIIQLLPEDYGDYITRLLNLVESQFPSADAFIDDFLKDEE